MVVLDSSQYQAMLLSPCTEQTVWIYLICFLAMRGLKITLGAFLAPKYTEKCGPLFFFTWELASSCFYNRYFWMYVNTPWTPASHLAIWYWGADKRSPTHFCATGSTGSQHQGLHSINYDKESLNGQAGVLRGMNFPMSSCRGSQVTGFSPCVTTEIHCTESLMWCVDNFLHLQM